MVLHVLRLAFAIALTFRVGNIVDARIKLI